MNTPSVAVLREATSSRESSGEKPMTVKDETTAGSLTVAARERVSGRVEPGAVGNTMGTKVFSVRSRRNHRAPGGIPIVPVKPLAKAAYRPSSLIAASVAVLGDGVPSGVA